MARRETAPLALVGLGLILAGLVMVSWPGITGPAGDTTWEGDVLFIAAAILWAIYTRWWSDAGKSVRRGPSSWCGCWRYRTFQSTGPWMAARG